MKWVWDILMLLGRVLLPALLGRPETTAEDAARQPALRRRLVRRIRQTRAPTLLLAVCLLAAALVSCNGAPDAPPLTVYVPAGEPVRLRATIPAAAVWVFDAHGNPVAGVMDLPAGWYCLPDPGPPEDCEVKP